MKKLCSFVLIFILLFIMSPTAFAASSETYRLEDLGMSIDIPSEYIVFTRDIADDDPNLPAYGLSKQDLSDLMESRNIYLNAWDTDVSFEIIVTMIDSEISDFNLMSDTVLTTLASSFQDGYANSGITVEKYEIYQHDQAKFFKININQPNGSDIVYGLQYYTVYDHKAINITLQSYSGKIDTDKESVIASIVSTVHFDKEPLRAETRPDTEAFLYRDEDTGIEFTVPANWTQKPLSQDREAIDVKFTSNKEPGLIILYGSTDVWSEMIPSEKIGLSRAEVDNSMFTLEEFAETIGIKKNMVSMISFGGKEYYGFVNTTTSSQYGISLDITQTCFMRFENGYSYLFQFADDSTNPYYGDFKALLESVKYPVVENTPPSKHEDAVESTSSANIYAADETQKSSNVTALMDWPSLIGIALWALLPGFIARKKGRNFWAYYLLSFVITPLVTTIITLCLSKIELADNQVPISEEMPVSKSCSTDTPEKTASGDWSDSAPPLHISACASPRKIMYCRRCGAKLVEESKFCSNCGTLIEKGDIQ